jgi:hypothetical protein
MHREECRYNERRTSISMSECEIPTEPLIKSHP